MAARKSTKRNQEAPQAIQPETIQVDQPDQVIKAEGKAATPAHKAKTAAKLHWVPEGKDRTLCGIFHLDPRMTAADSQDQVTCAVCLKVLNAEPKAASKAKATKITIQCETCGKDHEIYEYQYGIVTRDPLCQKKYRRQKGATKRRIKTKARKAARRVEMRTSIEAKMEDAVKLISEYAGDKAMLAAIVAVARGALKA